MAQVWLVTGSSRGLGHAIVEAGLAAGNKVLATARDIKSLGRSGGTIWRSGQAFCNGCDRRSSSSKRGNGGGRCIWLAAQSRSSFQSCRFISERVKRSDHDSAMLSLIAGAKTLSIDTPRHHVHDAAKIE
jgi:NAD(P)-dependent dehydrogenase (short-subunit alcohol dehydrogenase family)